MKIQKKYLFRRKKQHNRRKDIGPTNVPLTPHLQKQKTAQKKIVEYVSYLTWQCFLQENVSYTEQLFVAIIQFENGSIKIHFVTHFPDHESVCLLKSRMKSS